MATKLKLTWLGAVKQWKKRRDGKTYYVGTGKSKWDLDGYHQALAKWEAIEKKLDADDDARAARVKALEDYHAKMLRPVVELTPTTTLTPVGFEQAPEDEATIDGAGTIGAVVEKFKSRKLQQARSGAGKCGLGRVATIHSYINQFADFIGRKNPVNIINAISLLDWHSQQIGAVQAGTLSADSAKGRMQVAKQFVKWAWSISALTDLPRNIDSDDLEIRCTAGKIKTIPVKDLTTILASMEGRMRLCLLLMLNCGMTQKDIADLRQDEVDWTQGTITRKRSKTHQWENVPTVTYPLWQCTFDMLKKYRAKSGDLAIIGKHGNPLVREYERAGKIVRVDAIANAYSRAIKNIKGIAKPYSLKLLRKTSSTMLDNHPDYGRYAIYFLGQSSRIVASRHYINPSDQQFALAVEWLRQQYGIDQQATATATRQRQARAA